MLGEKVLPFLLRYENEICYGVALLIIRAMDIRLFD
jgi:hypothetical protein